MTFLRSVRESFNSRGGKEVASWYWSSASQQLYLLHCHSEFRRRNSPNLRPCWILLFRRGTLHSLIKQDCYYQFSCFGGRPNLSNAQPSIKTIQASVATLVLSINLMKWMPFAFWPLDQNDTGSMSLQFDLRGSVLPARNRTMAGFVAAWIKGI